ncbi:MAG: SCP2 sterol-binding domain-containing protein [Acidimicrobiales bacterium]
MPAWLSEQWGADLSRLAGSRPTAPGAKGTVAVSIAGGPREVQYHWSYRDGVPGNGDIGAGPEADLALSISAADALTVVAGEVEPSVAFMRGRLKATGDGALLLAFLASTAGADYAEWRNTVAALTEQ